MNLDMNLATRGEKKSKDPDLVALTSTAAQEFTGFCLEIFFSTQMYACNAHARVRMYLRISPFPPNPLLTSKIPPSLFPLM